MAVLPWLIGAVLALFGSSKSGVHEGLWRGIILTVGGVLVVVAVVLGGLVPTVLVVVALLPLMVAVLRRQPSAMEQTK